MQTYIERLVNAGIPYACADEIVREYWAEGDIDGLLSYVKNAENRCSER